MPMDSEPREGRPAMLQSGAVGWLCTTSVAMGGINQSRFLIAALFVGNSSISGKGHVIVPLLAASAGSRWYLPSQSVPWTTARVAAFLTLVDLHRVARIRRLALPVAMPLAALALLPAVVPTGSGSVGSQQPAAGAGAGCGACVRLGQAVPVEESA